MKTYALKYKNSYYQFTQNKKDLDIYKNNKITNIVELEIIKTRMKYRNDETNTEMFHYIKGLEFSYNIMKQIGIYK